ncbi:MAG: S24 family peptidase [FCB group bacterium]|jgi:DNA polymerase V
MGVKSKQTEFELILQNATKQELYTLAKKYYIFEQTGVLKNSWKFLAISKKCKEKNPKILADAINDANITLNYIEDYMNELRVVDIKRIDYLSRQELINFLETNIGAAKTQPPLDLNNVKKVDLLKAFGIQEGTIFCKVSGASMEEAKIFDGDTLIVDTMHEAKNKDIIVASVNNEVFVKRLKLSRGKVWLISENGDYEDVEIKEDIAFKIIGVVRNVVRKVT